MLASSASSTACLGIVIEFDLTIMREVIGQLGVRLKPGERGKTLGVFVTDLSEPLADCASRSIRLLTTPQAIPMLYPGMMREICYWLLTGPQGGQIARMAMAIGHEERVIQAIHSLRSRFAESSALKTPVFRWATKILRSSVVNTRECLEIPSPRYLRP